VGINNTGCADSSDIAITVLPILYTGIQITASDKEICDDDAVTFTAQAVNGGASPGYQWMLNNQPAGTSSSTWKSSGLKNGDIVSCVLQSQAACASPAILSSGIITMTVHPLPVVQPFADRAAIFKGDYLRLNAGITGAVSEIKWWPGIGLNNDTIAAPQARPATTTVYQVQATTQYGCTATGQVTVTVMDKQDIPNAFSPNGDGINDRWEIKYLDKFPGASVQVFNRYGQVVYTATGHQPGNGWDGRLKGQVLPMGTYYYIIDLKNGHEKLSGSITIIK
jgi:gliding motility-associated-like protein